MSDGVWQESDAAEMAQFNANGHKFQVGMSKPKDLNGDYKIDANNDRTIVGHRDPRWSLGLSTDVMYKGWELAIQAYGRMDYTYSSEAPWVGGRYNVRNYDYYSETNKGGSYSKPIYDEGGQDAYYAILGYKSGSYLKVRTISLGYTFPNAMLKGSGISNLKVYAQAKNPFSIFNKYESVDLDTQSGQYNQGFTFGVNLSF